MTKNIHVLAGGPYHPVTAQFQEFQSLWGNDFQFHCHEGVEAFDHLDECELLVVGGLHWTGSAPDKHSWPEGVPKCGYARPTEGQKKAFVDYVASGRPLLGWHGGIASYDDWTEFGALLGFRWDWRVTAHGRYQEWEVKVESQHPVVREVSDYRIQDELYYNVQVTPGMEFLAHAWVHTQDSLRFPMILTGEGGRIPGAGKTAYLANGHDLKSSSSPMFRQAVHNTLQWLLTK